MSASSSGRPSRYFDGPSIEILGFDAFVQYLFGRVGIDTGSGLDWADLDSFQIMEIVAALDEDGVILEEEIYAHIASMHDLHEAYIAEVASVEVG